MRDGESVEEKHHFTEGAPDGGCAEPLCGRSRVNTVHQPPSQWFIDKISRMMKKTRDLEDYLPHFLGEAQEETARLLRRDREALNELRKKAIRERAEW